MASKHWVGWWVGACACVVGLASHTASAVEDEDDDEDEELVPCQRIDNHVSTGSCGVERWAVKTGTDSAASQIKMTPMGTTVGALGAIPVPSGFSANSSRFTFSGSPEIQVFRLTNVTLFQYKLESDSDYHLDVKDATGSMPVEIPYPGCVSSGPLMSQITSARATFDAKYTATTSYQPANDIVTITGVGFFDVLHGQAYALPNGIELHAVLSICFGMNCAGGGPPPSDAGVAGSPDAAPNQPGPPDASTTTSEPEQPGGTTTNPPAGCACRVGDRARFPLGGMALAMLALLVRRRRPRRR
jgi:MYXO-CTERM domain-containing protein